MTLTEKSINFLREECNSKNQLINLLLENLFKTDMAKVFSSKNNNNTLTANDNYRFPKRFTRSHYQKSPHNEHINNNRLHTISVNEENQNETEEQHESDVTPKTP